MDLHYKSMPNLSYCNCLCNFLLNSSHNHPGLHHCVYTLSISITYKATVILYTFLSLVPTSGALRAQAYLVHLDLAFKTFITLENCSELIKMTIELVLTVSEETTYLFSYFSCTKVCNSTSSRGVFPLIHILTSMS